MGMLLLCCSSLVLLAHARSAAIGITAAGLLVFCLGSEADVAPYLIARYCGLKNFSTLYGLSWTFYAFGAAIGPIVTGRAFDHAGGYESGFITLLSLPCFGGALLTLLLPNYATAASPGAVLDSMLPRYRMTDLFLSSEIPKRKDDGSSGLAGSRWSDPCFRAV